MARKVKLSSKGQIVLPKDVRERLGLKKGDELKVEIDEQTKSIVMQHSVEPPQGIFVRVGTKKTSALLRHSDEIDEKKIKKLLGTIGVRSTG